MKKLHLYLFAILFGFLFSCNDHEIKNEQKPEVVEKKIKVPQFNADSAYLYVKEQLGFGPRVPATKASDECASYLAKKFEAYNLNVIVQKGKVRLFDGKTIPIKNIIASYKPETNKRILLCAHWDSRPFCDYDSDKSNYYKAVPGANDGASGVGVLLEVARQLSLSSPEVGIDIILFDAEDYGKPEGKHGQTEDTWALGSQYWAKNLHKQNYYARFGILLDMVGAKDATFRMEGTSMYFAPDVMRKVWKIAAKKGYGMYFLNEHSNPLTDDHLYVNQIARIPTIDIIHTVPNSPTGFFPHWHTINDDIDVIDKETLKAVGQTLLHVIYEER